MGSDLHSFSHAPEPFVDSVKFRRVKLNQPASAVVRPVVSVTDFSAHADVALEVAAGFARQLEVPLAVTHAVELPCTLARDAKASRWLVANRKRTLHETTTSLREKGVEVLESARPGALSKTLLQTAQEKNAQLIIMPVARRRTIGHGLRVSAAARLASRSRTPILVLRDAEPLREWMENKRPLKIFVAYNFSATAEAALHWVKQLTHLGPCEVVLAYANQPTEDYIRIGARGPLPFGHNSPDVLAVLERDLKARARAILGDVPVRCRVEPDARRTDVRLAQIARDEGADLIVVGSRQYAGVKRLRYGSVSRALLKRSSVSVAIVPPTAAEGSAAIPVAVKRHVLVATDFSAGGNTAVPHALALLPEGGLLTLMHVVPFPPIITDHVRRELGRDAKLSPTGRAALSSRLRQLLPADAAKRGIFTQTEIVTAADAGQAISQTAERLSVDAICLASGNRNEVSRAFLGSVTRTVRSLTRRPLLVVPVPRF